MPDLEQKESCAAADLVCCDFKDAHNARILAKWVEAATKSTDPLKFHVRMMMEYGRLAYRIQETVERVAEKNNVPVEELIQSLAAKLNVRPQSVQ